MEGADDSLTNKQMSVTSEDRKFGRTEVRVARLNDVRKLSTFFRESWKESGPGALGFAGATSEAIQAIASEEFLTKRLASPNTKILIAEEGGRFLGFASIRRIDRGSAELTGIVVLQAATGRGLGTKLLRKANDIAMKQRFRTMMVKTEVFNQRAIGFYKKMGFVETNKARTIVGRTKTEVQVLTKRLR